MAEVITQIDDIPVTTHYTDKAGKYIGKELTRWIDVKARVLEILKEYERQEKEGKAE